MADFKKIGEECWRLHVAMPVEPQTDAAKHFARLMYPKACVTCGKADPCGCPGEGWAVPIHTRLPVGAKGVMLINVQRFEPDYSWHVDRWFDGGEGGYPGGACFPVVPFLGGHPVWIDPWEEE